MSYVAWSVVFGEQPTAAKWNILGDNDASFHDGTGIDDNAIITRHINAAAVTAPKLGVHTKAGVISGATLGTTGNKSISGLGFTPRLVMFDVLMLASSSSAATGNGAMITGGTQFWTAMTVNTSNATPNVRNGGTDACVGWLSSGSTSPSLKASYVSMDADGFTINVTAASSAFDVGWVAIA